MIRTMSLAFACLLLLQANLSFAQLTDSVPSVPLTDSLSSRIRWNTPPLKRVFPYKQFIVPATMLAYGIVTLHYDGLKSVNSKIKEEVYMERNNKKPMHIDNYLLYAPAVAVYGLNAAGIKGKNNFRDRTILLAMSQMIQCGLVFPVKSLTKENRPDGSNTMSFPSGHTSTAFASAEFLRQEYKDVSPLYGVAGYAVAASTGFLRMYNNKHWLSDVVAGAGIGIMSTKLAYWMYPAIKRKFFKDKEVSTMVAPTYQDRAIGLALVHHF